MSSMELIFGSSQRVVGGPREFLGLLDHMSYAGSRTDEGVLPPSVEEAADAEESFLRMWIMEHHGAMAEVDVFLPGDRGRNTTLYRKMHKYDIHRWDLAAFWMDFEVRNVGGWGLFERVAKLALLSIAEWVVENGSLAVVSLHAARGASAVHMHVLWEPKEGDAGALREYLVKELS